MRAASNIDEEKKNKSALREVIIAGVDGVIRFIDLEDGTLVPYPAIFEQRQPAGKHA